jgi:hypothetical protein
VSGEDQQIQQQTQQSTTSPWDPATPLLTKLLGKYKGLNTDVTSGQSGALSDLMAAASGTPNFGAQSTGAINNLFSSSTAPQVGMLTDALARMQGNIGATASGAELDPYRTPGFGDALSTTMDDITDRVKGVYAGSGRSPSGAGSFAGSLGRGLTEGVSPLIASQYNQNKANMMAANRDLLSAAGSTATGVTGQEQVELGNQTQAMGLLPQLLQALQLPATAKLGAANAQYSQPFANLAAMLNPTTQIAGLGGQSTGSSTGTVTQPQSTTGNIMGGISTGIGLLSLLSDERAKENIEPVGALNDGKTVYAYNYKGSNVPQIGLIAQEVAETDPDAVTDFGDTGLLAVNYHKATRRAAEMARA